MKHQKIEEIVAKRFTKINEALDKARTHFQEDDIRIFRVKIKKLVAFLNLINVSKDHDNSVKLPQKITKLYELFGEIRTLQMHQNHILATIKNDKTGLPDAYLKLISEQILQKMEDVGKYVKGSNPFKKGEEKVLSGLPRQLKPDQLLYFVHSEGNIVEKLFNPVFLDAQSFHDARKHLKSLLYISPYTDLSISVLSPYKLLSNFEDIELFAKLLGSFHDLNIDLAYLYKMAKKIEPDEAEKVVLRRLEQVWVKAKEVLRTKIYDDLQKVIASGRTVSIPTPWLVM